MVTKLLPLYLYSSDVFSQNGEDGIIKFLLEELKIINGLILEVGAHNGIWCSNTRNLYANNPNFKTILIEGNEGLFAQLCNNTNNFTNVEPVKVFIEINNKSLNSIDGIISLSKFQNENFILASIDIDGSDYDVWKAMETKPTILIIEVPVFLEKDPDKKNIIDYIELGKEKNYTLLGMSGYENKQAGNMIFLHNDFIKHFELPDLHERILLHGGTRWEIS